MSIPFPPTPGIVVFPPPPPRPPPPPCRPPPSPPTPPTHNKSAGGGAIAGISIAVGFLLFIVSCMCSLIRGQRQSGATNDAAALASPPPPRTVAPDRPRRGDHQPRAAAAPLHEGEPRRAGLAETLPSFTYNRSVKHNVTGGDGEETATCSVCLAAFRTGEAVRLLPVCLHLYHVECIDPWLDTHSSCPICRTGTDPSLDEGLLPPV